MMAIVGFLVGLYLVIGLLVGAWALLMATDLMALNDEPMTLATAGALALLVLEATLLWPAALVTRWAD